MGGINTEISNKTRLNRLRRLYETVGLHVGQRGKPVKLNGEHRGWDMNQWECGSSACALGCYALTPYGKRYFTILGVKADEEAKNGMDYDGPPAPFLKTHIKNMVSFSDVETIPGAAKHFGITHDEAEWLFMPDAYEGESKVSTVEDGISIPPSLVRKRVARLIRKYEKKE